MSTISFSRGGGRGAGADDQSHCLVLYSYFAIIVTDISMTYKQRNRHTESLQNLYICSSSKYIC